ncbi:SAT2 acetyltransferase, partial [Polypterus senegalus]
MMYLSILRVEELICIIEEGHTIVGYCLYFYTYSTWEGRVIYMEDLYVMPKFRGNGIGKAMMCRIAQIGRQSECARLQFNVLNWNKPSIEFYKSHGALDLTEKEGWHAMRFEVAAMEKLAQMTGHTVVGYSMYYFVYSPWKGRSVCMEDLYVMPDFRGQGIGKALMCGIAKIGWDNKCTRLQFVVLDWNKPSIDFYKSHGAQNVTEKEGWQEMRIDDNAMEKLAQMAPKI